MARLARSVHVTDPKTHQPLILNAGDEPVPWVAALITNPLAWENGEVPDSTPPPAPDPVVVDPEQPADPGAGEDPAVVEPDPEPEPETAGDEAADPQPEPEPVKRPSGRRNTRKGDAAAE